MEQPCHSWDFPFPPLPPQRTLQKQSVVYGGKSTIRDRSSGTASSVAFTPLQVPARPAY